MIVLAGDIGGTRTRLALATVGAHAPRLESQQVFASGGAAGLGALVREFLAARSTLRPERACFGAAGPVANGRVRLVNVDWELDAERLGAEIGIPATRIINDFAAIGYAIPLLDATDVVELQSGAPPAHAPIAAIGAGTGLGHGFLIWERDRYQVHTSEAGHADFAPRTALEAELAVWLRARHGHVSWERVVSGPGLASAYEFFAERRGAGGATLRGEPDVAAAVTARALAGSDAAAAAALDLFVSAYGAQAANFVLAVAARGGVYIAGGIAPQILPKLREGGFLNTFLAKGRLGEVLATVPVRVITWTSAGLVGAAVAAAEWRGP